MGARLQSVLAGVLLAASTGFCAAAPAYDLYLSPGPRLVGTRAASSGGGAGTVTLSGNRLILDGRFHGALGAPTAARLLAGSAPGVRGPAIGDVALTMTGPADGTFHAEAALNSRQRALLAKGGLYVEIDSGPAPEGDLWGWIMPQ